MGWLKQSTAVTLLIGPFLDDTDGKTAETGLTISQADVRLSKNGGNMAQKNESTSCTHDELGYYTCPLDTTDTGTLGKLRLMVHESGALPVWCEYEVVPANVYDSLILGTDLLQTDVDQVDGDATAAANLNSACDNYSATRGLSGTALPAAAADAAGGLVISDAGGLDIDTVASNVSDILTDTGTTLDGKLDTIDGNVDSILEDTGTDGVVVASASKSGYSLTANTGLGNQTANITGNLSGSVGSVTGAVGSVTGAVGSVTAAVTVGTNNDKTGYGLADDAITSAKFDEATAFPLASADTGATAVARTGADSDTLETLSDEIAALNDPSAADIADAVWDELLSGSEHATATSAGRRLRELSSDILLTGTSTAVANGSTYINLDTDASTTDGAYDPAIISIVAGTGAGQSRQIFEYDGTLRRAYVNRDWKVIPDDTSEYIIMANFGDTHVNEGKAQAGANTTITLNTLASSVDDAYNNQVVFIVAGTGADQARVITDYVGATKVATVHAAWGTNPDATSIYAVIPEQACSPLTSAAILALLDDARTEPGQGAPPVNPDAVTKIDYLYKAWRNKTTSDADSLDIYNDAGDTVDQKATISDDGTTFTRSEIGTGA